MEEMFESLDTAIVASDTNGIITLFNKAAVETFGYSKEEALGQSVEMLMPKSYQTSHQRFMDLYTATNKKKLIGKPRVLPAQKKNGDVFRVELSLSVNPNPTDKHVYYGAFRLLTQVSTAKGLEMFECLMIPVVVADETCHISALNDAAALFFGYKKEELIHQNVSCLMPSPFREEHAQYVDNYAQGGEAKLVGKPRELKAQRKDGTIVDVTIRLNKSPNPTPEKTFFATFTEVQSTSDQSGQYSQYSSSDSSTDMGSNPSRSFSSNASSTSGITKADSTSSVEELTEKVRTLEMQVEKERRMRKALEKQQEDAVTASTKLIPASDLILKEKIGDGGFAKVYRAYWLGKEVAVKKMTRKVDSKSLQSFAKETAVLGQLHHPNIVLFMGICRNLKEKCAIVTEYLGGGSLSDLITKQRATGPFERAVRIRLAKDIALGLAYLHGIQPPIVHRDLKSLNILMDEHGKAKVGDFGLSRATANTMTATLGTPHWMAPEVLQGTPNYTLKADVYSYGMVVWEICHLEVPWHGMDVFRMIATLAADPEARPEISEDIEPDFQDIMKKCFKSNPDERPTISEVVDLLSEME